MIVLVAAAGAQTANCSLAVDASAAGTVPAPVVLGDFVASIDMKGGWGQMTVTQEQAGVLAAARAREAFLAAIPGGRMVRHATESLHCRPSPPMAVDPSRCAAGFCRPFDWDPDGCGFLSSEPSVIVEAWAEVRLELLDPQRFGFQVDVQQPGSSRPKATAKGSVTVSGPPGSRCEWAAYDADAAVSAAAEVGRWFATW